MESPYAYTGQSLLHVIREKNILSIGSGMKIVRKFVTVVLNPLNVCCSLAIQFTIAFDDF